MRRYGLAVIASLTAILTFPVFAAAASFPAPPGPASSGVAGPTRRSLGQRHHYRLFVALGRVMHGGVHLYQPSEAPSPTQAEPTARQRRGRLFRRVIVDHRATDTTDSGSVLTAVACTPTLSRLCLALGSDGAFSYALIKGADGAWTQTAPMIRVAQNIGFDGAACPSRTRSIAAGDSYNSVSTPAPLVESWNGKSWHVAKLAAVGRGGGLSSVVRAPLIACAWRLDPLPAPLARTAPSLSSGQVGQRGRGLRSKIPRSSPPGSVACRASRAVAPLSAPPEPQSSPRPGTTDPGRTRFSIPCLARPSTPWQSHA